MINSSPSDGAAVGEDFLLLKVRATVEVNKSGDTFTGSYQVEIFDGEGNVVPTVNGTVRGTRFGVETLG